MGDARFEPVSLPKLATTSPDIFSLWKDGGRCDVAMLVCILFGVSVWMVGGVLVRWL